MSSENTKLEQLIMLTNLSEGKARQLLNDANGDVSMAYNTYADRTYDASNNAQNFISNIENKCINSLPTVISDSSDNEEYPLNYEGNYMESIDNSIFDEDNSTDNDNEDGDEEPELFKSARKNGAYLIEDSMPIIGAPKRPLITITFWQDGFTVEDGELRLIYDENNRDFMTAVTHGRVPEEIEDAYRNIDIDVNMVDNTKEEYPKKNVKGQSQKFGNTDQLVEVNRRMAIVLDQNKPSTAIQVKLANGFCFVVRANLSNTIDDLYAHIRSQDPSSATKSFSLIVSYPSQILTDMTKTVESAGLKNATIVQRM